MILENLELGKIYFPKNAVINYLAKKIKELAITADKFNQLLNKNEVEKATLDDIKE